MTAIVWSNALILAGGLITTALSLGVIGKLALKGFDKSKTTIYKKKIEELEKLNSMIKFATITKEEHSRIVNETLGERQLLLDHVRALKEEKKELNERIYNISRQLSKTKETNGNYEKLGSQLKTITEEYETALDNMQGYLKILKRYLDPVSIEVILGMINVYPYSITAQDLADILEKNADTVYNCCVKLEKEGWIKKMNHASKKEETTWILKTAKKAGLASLN